MPLSPSDHLTAQFYDFELRGRGWHYAPFTVELEPPFYPFYGYHTPRAYIDDGRKETALSLLAGLFKARPAIPVIEEYESPPFEPYPYDNIEPLRGYAISLPKQSKPAPDLMEQCLVMLSGITEPLSFELLADHNRITIQFCFRASYDPYIYSQLKAYFPEAIVLPVQDFDTLISPDRALYTADFGLAEETMRPINMERKHGEPLMGLFGICDQLHHDERVVLQVLFNGTVNKWADSMERVVSDGGKGSFFYDAPEMPILAREKCAHVLFAVAVRTLTQADTMENAFALLQRVSFAVTQATTSPFNALAPLPVGEYSVDNRIDDIILRQSHRVGMLLNSRELATLVHVPAQSVSRKLRTDNRATRLAQASLINAPYILGINSHHGVERAVGIDAAQRLRHIHIIGATGTGKSTLLKNLIYQDINNNIGCCCIDPHGDLIDGILSIIPEHRIKDVVLIDPSDAEFPVALNILSAHSDLEKELLSSDLVALFRRFSTSWGDQMNSVFANAISTFVYNAKAGHLGDLRKFLIDPSFRNAMLTTCTDPDIVYYWQKEYPILKSSSIGSILTRLDSFLRPRIIRNMVCQTQSLNFQQLMDGNKIILVKLSQGLIGEENGYLLGAFIVSKLQQIAMARQAQQATERKAFHCYIDEFQHFVTPSMATILSGGRKYALSLILAHQDMHQVSTIDNNIASSLLANAGTRICFRLGDTDAKRMQEGFGSFTAEDLQNLNTGNAIGRVNTADQDFNISVIPHTTESTSYRDAVIAHSRSIHSVPVATSLHAEPTEQASKQPPAPTPTPPPHFEPVVPIAEMPVQEVREHRYLQTFIKKTAEEYGYKANIEVPTPDGTGQVDVLLEKDGRTFAIEISVSTTATWELHNAEKCLTAGYTSIIICSSNARHLAQIRQKVVGTCTAEQCAKITFAMPEQIRPLLSDTAPHTPTATIMKGYRVKVQYEQSEGTHKSEVIQRIMNAGRK